MTWAPDQTQRNGIVRGNSTIVTGHKRRLFIGRTHTATVGIKANVLMPLKNPAQINRSGGLIEQSISGDLIA